MLILAGISSVLFCFKRRNAKKDAPTVSARPENPEISISGASAKQEGKSTIKEAAIGVSTAQIV